jgi:exodeoxyribonuclease VII large subunit
MNYNNTYESNIKEYTVTELSNALKKTLEINFDIIHLKGEISGLTTASSGHVYLSLKDKNNSLIDGIIWKGQASRINFKLEDGIEVLVIGRLSTYAPRSKYNIIINSIKIAGEGALLKLIEERRRLFAEEGLFKEEFKKPLPYIPEIIGIVTTDSGAAFDDIIVRVRNRFPVKILFYPVAVQGPDAVRQISKAINEINNLSQLQTNIQVPDVLIVGRGGGSLEDLMAFNEEEVVRAIFESKIPIISAVGHEIDNSLSDYVADVRAPTPTAAAEIALPDISVLKNNVEVSANAIISSIQNRINFYKEKYKKYILPNFFKIIENKIQSLDITNSELTYKTNFLMENSKNKISKNKIEFYSPLNYCKNQIQNLSSKAMLLDSVYKNLIDKKYHLFTNKPKSIHEKYEKFISGMRLKYTESSTALEAYSYNKILEKGFALIKNEKNKSIIRSKNVIKDTKATIYFYDGTIKALLKKNG